jgi:DNA mismatch repair protein MutS2
LIDEIAADTDPTQGQALAQAVLEDLADHGAHVVVTTHFERLKAVPFADRRFRNAGVGFDQNRLKPTYKVSLDMPQSSSGLDIAQGLGLPARIVDRARTLTGEGSQALEKLMVELERRQQELSLARRGAEIAEREAAREKQKLIEMQRSLDREKESFRVEARAELLEEIERSREEVRAIISKLQSATESQSARDAMRAAQEASATLAKAQEAQEAKQREAAGEEGKSEALRAVAVGDWVHVKQIGKDGDVVSIDGKEAQVAVGNMRMRVPVSALGPAKSRRPKRQEGPERGRLKKELGAAQKDRPIGGPAVTEELDLRGHAIDESLDRLDAFLDHHYGTPITHVRIVHGHGTGALRMAIRAHLKASGYVRSIRPGDEHEGGDGATIVELA